MRIILFLLASTATGLWAFGYVYIHSLACAFGNISPCRVPMPWEERGEDLIFWVLIPGVIAAGLWALFVRAMRRGRSN